MYQVLARKWRPQSFDELVGQRHITRTLANSVKSGRLAHAYLFAGLRGTGKTTVARILAKCLNCENGPTTEPCSKCSACTEVMASRAIDVLEIDAASRTKVEQTRELLEMVSYAPARDRYKILIIDEAHMLSKASFNALLKTLEEPPPNVIFIMATTEIQKVLPTILSRCQVFEFRRVPSREVAAHLRQLCDSESVEISDASLDRVARAGEGSVRDSLSVLERVLAFSGDKISDDDVLRALGAVRAEVLIETVRGIAARDAGVMLSVLDSLVDEGHDLIHFWGELIAALRDLLFQEAVPDRAELLSRSADEASALADAAKGLSQPDLLRAFQVLADLEPALKSSSHPKFMFEAALIRLAALGNVRPIEEILADLQGGGNSTRESNAGQRTQPAEHKTIGARRPSAPPRESASASPSPPETQPASPRETTREEPDPKPVASAKTDGGSPQGGSGFIQSVRSRKPMIGAMLEQADSVSLDGNRLTISFAPENDALAKSLERKEVIETLESCAAEEQGRKIRISVKISAETSGTRNAPGNSPVQTASSEVPRTTKAPTSKELLDVAKAEPGVRKILREFGAQVLEVNPLAALPIEPTGLEDSQ